MHPTVVLAAPGFNGMQLLGAVTLTFFAAASAICLIAGLKGSDRIKIQNKDQALIWGFVTGALWVNAGGTWADWGKSFGDVGRSMTADTGFGDPGVGGSACLLLLVAWAWPFKKRMAFPAFLAISGAVLAGQAGGIPGMAVGIIRAIVSKMAGG
ncbi:hypothetical protein [Streptomyces werraensis]|uniref:hypothetical protein n=1 Tax=Streptomyces werraensis TaxID=68284 RepID=UPI0037D89642